VLMICTPTRFHVPMAKLGMEAGLAVLTEKGMAPDWDSAQDLVAFTQKQKGLLCVAQNYRYKAMESTIKVLLDKDQQEMKMGPVYFADFTQHRVRPEPRTLNYPFASVWDMSCHHFDNMLFWFGAPESMTAQAFGPSWSAYEFPNNTSAHIVFKSGVRVHYFHGHDSAKATNELHVEGQCGAILLEGDKLRYYSRPNVQFGKSEPVEVVYPEVELPSELGVLKDFHTYVVEGKEPGISGRNNLEVMAMCQMMVMSVEQNRPVLREELNG
jgi:predicted dehydrogenase